MYHRSMTNKNGMTHKEMAAHIRARLKASGIKARVNMNTACGIRYIYIDVPEYEVSFSEAEQREALIIASANRLTLANGGEIDINQMTYRKHFCLEFHE
jgi:hypothetical protein